MQCGCCCRATAVLLCLAAAPLPQVAIKKVLQDKRFKNRELQIIRMMSHPNIVQLKHCFYTTTEKDEVGSWDCRRAAGSSRGVWGMGIERGGQEDMHNCCLAALWEPVTLSLTPNRPAYPLRAGLPQPGAGVCARHSVPHQQALHQERAAHAHHPSQAVHVPDAARAGAHP